MLSIDPLPPKFREGRSWGCETRYGSKGFLETIDQKEGFRPITLMECRKKIGNMYCSAERRFNAGVGMRLEISAWASFPFVSERLPLIPSEVKQRVQRLHAALRRLIRAKSKRFFREQRNGKTAGVKN